MAGCIQKTKHTDITENDDALSSYLAIGTYTENYNLLELKTDDGKYHYKFDV